uniref:Cyclic nucleotide-binding domain-containing protein n=1 Tax=Guillardia theta TaxID=55529 RepID=A0A7S4NRA4_GUITH|mmetsp:Transcript_30761/g.98949  ORF Transcript_30761/g.98949 Transcript_30761/m.98949 type:complete len:682 (+) Transcript_30761:239-2284(+)
MANKVAPEDEVGHEKLAAKRVRFSRQETITWHSCFVPGSNVLEPYSTGRLTWDLWIIFLLAVTVFTVPYALAFQSSSCGSQRGLGDTIFLWFMDACFWTDIFIHFNTAIVVTDPYTCKMELVLSRREIARQYLRLWFWLDAFGSLPVQAIEDALSSGTCSLSSIKALRFNRLARLARLAKLVRLLRLAKWNRIITKLKDSLAIHPGYLKLLEMGLFGIVLAHILACIIYGYVEVESVSSPFPTWASEASITIPGSGIFVLKCPDISLDSQGDALPPCHEYSLSEVNCSRTVISFTSNGQQVSCLQPDSSWKKEAPDLVKYVMSLYLIFMTLTTVGYGDLTMKNIYEMFLGIAVMSVGTTAFAIVVGNMTDLIGNLDVRALELKDKMDELDDFMHQENLPINLRVRTRRFFEHVHNHSREVPPVVRELPITLQSEVSLYLYADLIRKVHFFKRCSKEFVTDVVRRCKPRTLAQSDFLFLAGEYGDSMFFIIDGTLEVQVDAQNNIFALLESGSHFGEKCVLGIEKFRPVTVRALTWSNLFSLSSDDLEECIYRHPDSHEMFLSISFSGIDSQIATLSSPAMKAKKKPRMLQHLSSLLSSDIIHEHEGNGENARGSGHGEAPGVLKNSMSDVVQDVNSAVQGRQEQQHPQIVRRSAGSMHRRNSDPRLKEISIAQAQRLEDGA